MKKVLMTLAASLCIAGANAIELDCTFDKKMPAGVSMYGTVQQENGTSVAVNDKGYYISIIRFAGEKPFEFSALPYTMEALDEANHVFELPEPTSTEVIVCYKNRGVGSGTATIKLIDKYKMYKEATSARDEAQLLMSDPEMRDLAEAEYYEARELCQKLEDEIKILLLPRDPNDDRNVIVEIRGGAGGEEAALWYFYAILIHWQNRNLSKTLKSVLKK